MTFKVFRGWVDVEACCSSSLSLRPLFTATFESKKVEMSFEIFLLGGILIRQGKRGRDVFYRMFKKGLTWPPLFYNYL